MSQQRTLGLSVNDMLVSAVQVLSSVSNARRTTGESLVSNCKAIQHLNSTTESGKGGYKSTPFSNSTSRRNHTHRNNHTQLRPIYSGHTLSTWFGCHTERVKETSTGSAIVAEINTLELIDLLSPTNNLDRHLILHKKIRYMIEGRERHILITVPENHLDSFKILLPIFS